MLLPEYPKEVSSPADGRAALERREQAGSEIHAETESVKEDRRRGSRWSLEWSQPHSNINTNVFDASSDGLRPRCLPSLHHTISLRSAS